MKTSNKREYKDYCTICKFHDKPSFKITRLFIENLLASAKQLGKKALLILALKKNDKENYVLKCTIETKKRAT